MPGGSTATSSASGAADDYLLVHPDYVKHVLQDNHRNYPRPEFVDNTLKAVVGDGLVPPRGRCGCGRGGWRSRPSTARRSPPSPPYDRHHGRDARQVARLREPGAEDHAKSEMMHLSLAILAKALFKTDWGVRPHCRAGGDVGARPHQPPPDLAHRSPSVPHPPLDRANSTRRSGRWTPSSTS